ncbi:hypothetical protein GCWU000246_00296 [Jonquetella anthropi E3_33 E1]|nr:hypothetical protein GCWU000246_00296 [Jonquetella anthropi E3_33 E1]
MKLSGRKEATRVENWADEQRHIPVPEGYRLESDAAADPGAGDAEGSPYFCHLDFFNAVSTDRLTILPRFRTYQQTRPYSCASAVALMVLEHFGRSDWEELEIADVMASYHGLPPETRRPVPVSDLARFFLDLGWKVSSNVEYTKPFDAEELTRPWLLSPYASFPSERHFSRFCRWCLRHNWPMMVENIDWGGHWRLIVGYDTMGTETLADDVLILVDPHDTADHCQDGFVVEHLEKFFHTWYDIFVMEPHERLQPWVVAYPSE